MFTIQASRRLAALLLAVVATAITASPARAGGNWLPLLPDQDFYDLQIFAPPDLQEYSMYRRPSEGLFFSYDRLYMGITVPNVVPVGFRRGSQMQQFFPVEPLNPDIAEQLNTANGGFAGVVIYGTDQFNLDLDTSWLRTRMTWGNRYEGGWIYDDRGMLFSYWDSGPQAQTFTTVNEYALNTPQQTFDQDTATAQSTIGGIAQPIVTTTIVSTSPPPDHLITQNFTQRNETRMQSGGAAFIIRRSLGRRDSGSTVRFGLGPRFLQVADRYAINYQSDQYAFNLGPGGSDIQITNDPNQGGAGGGGGGNLLIQGSSSLTGQGAGSPLQRGGWETYTSNNIVGPELALQFESSSGRWTWLSEFRFTPGMNWQNMLYRGSNFPTSLSADYIRSTFETATTFSATSTTNSPVVLSGQPLYIQVFGVGQRNASNSAKHQFMFTPIGEWRFGGEFRLSQAILLRAGYTGMWMGQIARASANTAFLEQVDFVRKSVANPNYDPNQDVGPDNPITVVENVPVPYNRIGAAPTPMQDYLFANGVDFGIEIKY
jgi:hypothetical protein